MLKSNIISQSGSGVRIITSSGQQPSNERMSQMQQSSNITRVSSNSINTTNLTTTNTRIIRTSGYGASLNSPNNN
jgi:hypothetical protein